MQIQIHNTGIKERLNDPQKRYLDFFLKSLTFFPVLPGQLKASPGS
jgi:hypothetical protein